MEKLQEKNNQIEGYLNDLLKIFNGENNGKKEKKENCNVEKEVEFKVFIDGITKHSDFKELQEEIIDKLNGKIIFDGTIKDRRYYDTKNKDSSILNEKGISLVRVREQIDFRDVKNPKKDYVYTVKKYDDYGYNDELEYTVDENFGKEKLEKEYGLKEIKITKKKRKEIKINLNINGKEETIKLAFDKYFDKKNKKINAFFEVEAKSEEIIKKAYNKLKDLNFFKNKKTYFTTSGPKKLEKENKDQQLKNKINNFENKIGGIRKEILNILLELIDNKSIYKNYNEFFNNIKKENFNNKIDNNKELYNRFFNLIKKFLNKKIKKDNIYEKYFHRILNNENYKDTPDKKFIDKFEREYKVYIKIFLEELNNELLKNKNLKNSNEIKKILSTKIDKFIKILFIFNDSLTKSQLSKILSIPDEEINNFFQKFNENLEKLKLQQNLNNFKIWDNIEIGKNKKINNSRILEMLLNEYSKAISGKEKKPFLQKNIEKNLIEEELQQFEFLERRFSHWINSPKRDKKEFTIIKNLFLENFYHIFLLSKSEVAFKELNTKNCKFNQEFINRTLKKFNNFLLNKDNFLLKEKGPELLKYLIENIFNDNNKLTKEIIKNFIEYNRIHNLKILKNRDNKELEKKILEENFKVENINFELWQVLPLDSRIRILFGKIVKKPLKNGLELKEEILSDKNSFDTQFEKFLEYEFNKKNNKQEKRYKENFKIYKNQTKKQFEELKTYFSDNNLLEKTDKEKILYLVKNDINSFNLFVSWFQFNLKDKYVKNSKKNLKIEDLSLHSESFSEIILRGIGDDILFDDEFEFITSTSSAYNSSIFDLDYIFDLHDRIGNGKSINLLKNFKTEINGEIIFLKDLQLLYSSKEENDYSGVQEYLKEGLKTIRALINSEEINTKYLENLKKINFPIHDDVALKKLLEFQKLVYKIINPFAEKLAKKGENTTEIFSELIQKFIEEEGEIDYSVAPVKSYLRILEKAITKYGGNIELIGDSARGTIFGDNFYDLSEKTINFIKFLKYSNLVKSVRFEDKIGNPFKKAKRFNGYRDATLAITLKTGETIELQFQLNDYYNIKTGELKIKNNLLSVYTKTGKQTNIKNFDINKKIEKENIDFTQEEKEKIINYAKITNFKISKEFAKLFDFDLKELEKSGILKENGFNTDFTYNLERTIGLQYKEISYKLEILDRILFDIPAGIQAYKVMNKIL